MSQRGCGCGGPGHTRHRAWGECAARCGCGGLWPARTTPRLGWACCPVRVQRAGLASAGADNLHGVASWSCAGVPSVHYPDWKCGGALSECWSWSCWWTRRRFRHCQDGAWIISQWTPLHHRPAPSTDSSSPSFAGLLRLAQTPCPALPSCCLVHPAERQSSDYHLSGCHVPLQ